MSTKSVQILHVVTNIHDGGLEKVVYLICKYTERSRFNHTIAVLTKNQNDFLISKFHSIGVQTIWFDFSNRLTSLKSVIKIARELPKLVRLIRIRRIEVIHSHDFFPALIARLAYILSIISLYKPKKVIITLHNIFFWLSSYHHFINRLLSYFTFKIVCVSYAVRDYSMRHDRIKSSKYKVIYNGVESELFYPNPDCVDRYFEEFNISRDNFIIGNVGVLSIRKGHKYLLLALSELIKKYPHIRLLIIGSTRIHELHVAEEIYHIINSKKLENYVRIIEPRDDINKIYNLFNLYVMPSVSEGQSLSAIEAMLSSRICLFSDIEPFKEMITEGLNGFLFKSASVPDLINKIEYIIKNYNSLINIGTKAREIASGRYDLKAMCEEYEKLYRY